MQPHRHDEGETAASIHAIWYNCNAVVGTSFARNISSAITICREKEREKDPVFI